MRFPLSLSEIVTIRSIFRILAISAALCLVLWAVYGFTGALERAFTQPTLESIESSTPPPAAPARPASFARRIWNELAGTHTDALPDEMREYLESEEEEEGYTQFLPRELRRFPHETFLESSDGRVLWAELLQRPDESTIVFRRLRDGLEFTLPMARLAPDSRALIRQFPITSAGSHSRLSLSTPPSNPYSFPHNCQIRNQAGAMLEVTLLRRPDFGQITFRRRNDQQIFTIPISQLADSDQTFVRLFPPESP